VRSLTKLGAMDQDDMMATDINKILSYFLTSTCEWLRGSGPESEIVLSSRIRIARNIKAFPFAGKLSVPEQKALIGQVAKAVADAPIFRHSYFLDYSNLKIIDRQFLVERHLVSREHANSKGNRAVLITKNEVVSIMILEEDHLRAQVIQSGLNLVDAWRLVNKVESALEAKLPFSFHPNLGYLTACPTNVGTGLRSSCMLHLAGLVMTKQVNKVLQALSKLNLAARGFFGEGTQASGNFFQFSNQMTLGQNEEEIINDLERVIKQMIEHEREARNHLLGKRRAKLEDQVWRAVGALKSARVISSSEAMSLLSLARLGVDIGFVKNLSKSNLNALFLFMQPAHLQKLTESNLDSSERDQKRAELLRTRLKDVELA
jgi:protein arginine kinase